MSIAKRNSIGLVGGVISLAGLCIGIFTLGKKPAPVARRSSRVPNFAEPVEAAYDEPRHLRMQSENSEVDEVEPIEAYAASKERDVQEIAGLREEAIAESIMPESPVESQVEPQSEADIASRAEAHTESHAKPAASAPDSRTPADAIAALYKKGESNLDIARALGVSLGEVQLTIKLRGLNAIGAAAAGKKNG